MDLRAKLGLHFKKSDKPKVKKQDQQINELIYESINQEYQLSRLLPGKMVESDLGEFLLVEYRYPIDYFHGRINLGGLVSEEMSALCGVLKKPNMVCPKDLQNLIFLDTETTGLAGGAGTFAFLIGVGYFEEDEFVLRQYMMEDYHQELAMLDALLSELFKYSHLVTYNGKSYDWPLLEGRFIYHRIKEDFSPIHIDLLHPSRRFYKRRLERCNLGSIETEILDFKRTNDISGSEVPALFFRYLDQKDGRILLPVFQHNHWDILSLVTLIIHLIQAYLNPEDELHCPEDIFSAGKIYEDLGQVDLALKCYTQTLQQENASYFKQEVMKRLSFFYKRLGKMEEALLIWKELMESETNLQLYPYLELAKYFEHQCKDYQNALQMTEGAMGLVVKNRKLYSKIKLIELQNQLKHREQRLLKKIRKDF